ncbi:MAG: hypothetical protein WC833_08825 [Bacteroidales bacterium]|jgi:hypothetical protein
METNTNTALQTLPNITEIQKIIGDAPATLTANISSKEKAVKAADDLITAHTTTGMTPALDAQMAEYTDKAKKTITAINEKRKPFTQMMDELKKQFTGCETTIKAKVDEVQKLRDDYATKLMKEKQEQDRIAAEKLAREKEVIAVRQAIKTALGTAFYEFITSKKKKVNELFDTLTLEKFEVDSQKFSAPVSMFTPRHLQELRISVSSTILKVEEINALILEVAQDDALYVHYANEYRNIMTVFQKETVDKLPSKKQQLEDLAKADEEEKAKLLEQENKRKEEATAALQKEQDEASKTVEINAATQAAGETTQASMGALFSAAATEAPKVKTGTEIIVKNKVGYSLIFQFWFEHEGKDLDPEKIEKKTIGQMKKFCEDHAVKTGELIDSVLIEYNDVYKAK